MDEREKTELMKAEVRQLIDQLVTSVGGRKEYIIRHRYCIGTDEKQKTFTEMAKVLEVTPVRVAQLEKSGLKVFFKNLLKAVDYGQNDDMEEEEE